MLELSRLGVAFEVEAAKLQMVIDRKRGRESSPVQAIAAAVPAGKSCRTDAADPNA